MPRNVARTKTNGLNEHLRVCELGATLKHQGPQFSVSSPAFLNLGTRESLTQSRPHGWRCVGHTIKAAWKSLQVFAGHV